MEEELIKILKELKGNSPDPAYSRNSRTIILSAKKEPKKIGLFEFLKRFQSARLTVASEILSVLFITALIGAYYIQRVNDRDKLVVQANDLNSSIQLKLNEIKYLIQDPQALNHSKTTNLGDLLLKATEDLKTADADLKENKIAESLDKIKSAEGNLKEIESALQTNKK